MAITRAQQVRQMLNGGGAPSNRGDVGRDEPSRGESLHGGRSVTDAVRIGELKALAKTGPGSDLETGRGRENLEALEALSVQGSNFPGLIGLGLNVFKGPRQKLLRRNVDFFRNDPRTKKAREKYGLTVKGYQDYMSARLAGKIDAAGNPIMDEDDDNIMLPVDTTFAQAPSNMDQEPETEENEGLRLAFRADGGRIGAQEGGIMPRLNQLGSGVSSAEQMLQDINQRLQTAESSLGSDGANTVTVNAGMQQPTVLGGISGLIPGQPIGTPGAIGPEPIFVGELETARPNFDTAFGGAFKGLDMSGFKPVMSPQQDMVNFSINGNEVQGMNSAFVGSLKNYLDSTGQGDAFSISGLRAGGGGSLGIPAVGFADGGNVVGGEYDFESARQMYGLGKLVKKVTRTVKKIAKSPVGKAAIIGAGIYGLGGGFGAGFKMSNIPGFTAAKNFIIGKPLGFKTAGDAVARSGGLLDLIGGKVGAGIIGTSLLAGLLTAKQEEEAQELSRGEGIDIEAARRSILARAQGNIPGDFRATAFRAEGGPAEGKEPVAKKTMPLLDMGGKEMDLREEGGFVPIGRMEKADDVPARLSKNEFVFTADAVRNAGDGDVDKGAEVMYNMMKNLEAGGEVSEESQGLEGARKMFQTSQRLEEVL